MSIKTCKLDFNISLSRCFCSGVTPSSKNKTNKKHVSSAHIGGSDAHRKMIFEKSDATTYNLHLGDKNPQRDMSHNLLKTDPWVCFYLCLGFIYV
jgi:hypothetical protein